MSTVCTKHYKVLGLQTLSKPAMQLCLNKMLQSLAVTFTNNDRMDLHGVNQVLLIFLHILSHVAIRATDARAP